MHTNDVLLPNTEQPEQLLEQLEQLRVADVHFMRPGGGLCNKTVASHATFVRRDCRDAFERDAPHCVTIMSLQMALVMRQHEFLLLRSTTCVIFHVTQPRRRPQPTPVAPTAISKVDC